VTSFESRTAYNRSISLQIVPFQERLENLRVKDEEIKKVKMFYKKHHSHLFGRNSNKLRKAALPHNLNASEYLSKMKSLYSCLTNKDKPAN
jgi:hypothetical protein